MTEDSNRSGFMISAKDHNLKSDLIALFLKRQRYMKKRFRSLYFSVNKSLNWITFVMNEKLLYGVKDYINIITKKKNIEIKYSKLPTKLITNEGVKHPQIQSFHNSASETVKLYNFAVKYGYIIGDPIIKRATTKTKYHLKFNVHPDHNTHEILSHWDRIRGLGRSYLNAYAVNMNIHITDTKNNAVIALNKMFKYAIRHNMANLNIFWPG